MITAITLSALKLSRHDEKLNAGLISPEGLKALKLIESIGKVRHIVVTRNGDIYARLARTVKEQGTLLLTQ